GVALPELLQRPGRPDGLRAGRRRGAGPLPRRPPPGRSGRRARTLHRRHQPAGTRGPDRRAPAALRGRRDHDRDAHPVRADAGAARHRAGDGRGRRRPGRPSLMAVALLVRHGRTAANVDGLLAGWSPAVPLDARGVEQAVQLGRRLATTPLVAVVSSPLERCLQTADAITSAHDGAPPARHTDDAIGECHYGAWTGRPLAELAREPLWDDIQKRPSTVRFPPHDDYRAESMLEMLDRVVTGISAWDQRSEEEIGS